MLYGTLFVAVLIIAGLVSWAGLLWSRVMRARQSQRLMQSEQRQASQEQLRDSASRLADAMLHHDLNLSEGAIRLKVMLDHLLPADEREPYQAIYDMAERVDHFARGKARRNLNGMQRMLQDAEREKIEAEYRENVLGSARAVIEQFGEPRIGL